MKRGEAPRAGSVAAGEHFALHFSQLMQIVEPLEDPKGEAADEFDNGMGHFDEAMALRTAAIAALLAEPCKRGDAVYPVDLSPTKTGQK